MVKYILYIYIYNIYMCVCMWWKFPFQPCFHIFFPGISGPKTREIRNGWSFAGLSPRHRGWSLGTGCPAAVPRGADPDVSRAIRRSPGTTAAWELFGKSVWCEMLGMVWFWLAGVFSGTKWWNMDMWLYIYMHDDDDVPCFIGMFIVLHCM